MTGDEPYWRKSLRRISESFDRELEQGVGANSPRSQEELQTSLATQYAIFGGIIDRCEAVSAEEIGLLSVEFAEVLLKAQHSVSMYGRVFEDVLERTDTWERERLLCMVNVLTTGIAEISRIQALYSEEARKINEERRADNRNSVIASNREADNPGRDAKINQIIAKYEVTSPTLGPKKVAECIVRELSVEHKIKVDLSTIMRKRKARLQPKKWSSVIADARRRRLKDAT